MNDKIINYISQDDSFLDMGNMVKNRQVNLSRDLPNFSSFKEDNTIPNDIWTILPSTEYQNFLKEFGNVPESISHKKPSNDDIKKPTYNKIIKVKYASFDDIINIGNNFGIFIQCNKVDIRNSDNLIYSIIGTIYPEFVNFNSDYKYKQLYSLGQKLGYDLDELHLFNKFNYKGLINKLKFQNKLIQPSEIFQIERAWIQNYLSDYFNINIVILVNYLTFITKNFSENRLSIIIYYERGNYYVLTNNYQRGLFPYQLLQNIIDEFKDKRGVNPIIKLEPISKYNMAEVISIAKCLDIEIQDSETGKRKPKKVIYEEIRSCIPE